VFNCNYFLCHVFLVAWVCETIGIIVSEYIFANVYVRKESITLLKPYLSASESADPWRYIIFIVLYCIAFYLRP